uniref:SH2 domain-containing protein n=1 Tax=Anabas testudineus TaxID=64144 RepID=A0A7N6C219_ANATE
MAQPQEPLYDFPEPTPLLERKFLGHQRGHGSLKSITVLDRLLLTVPVWLQLSINPATALHILQREPPGTFLVRKSRTSQKRVLCVRLADDSMPSFVQQFGISEENTTLSLEKSAISFPDLPKLISFYCVSRDVLPFPLELPEAIAKATSHKELESISHMGVEFWSSHLNVRGKQPAPNPTVFQTICPITTRSPKELDCGSGALCFINPLFLQSQDPLSRRRMFQRSIKIRVSTETATLLSPPLAPPPPPPLMPKTKGRCKAQKQEQGTTQPCKEAGLLPCKNTSQGTQDAPSEPQGQATSATPHFKPEMEEQGQMDQAEAAAQLPTVKEHIPDDSEYKQPSPVISSSHSPSLSPYLSVSPPIFPKLSPTLSPHNSPSVSPSPSPYHSPSLSPRAPISLSPHDASYASPSHSPRQSPSPSPKVPFSLSPFTSPSLSQLAEEAYHTPAAHSRADQQRLEREDEEEGANEDEQKGGDAETNKELQEKAEDEEKDLVLQMNAACLNNSTLCQSATQCN